MRVARSWIGSAPFALVAVVAQLGCGGPADDLEVVEAAPGLVAAYGFDEGAGGAAADASGNGNGGSLVNAGWSSAGRHGGAASFNGSSSRITVADAASLHLTRMTLEAWVRPTVTTGWRTVILKEQPGELVYALYAGDANDRPEGIAHAGGAERHAIGASQLPAGAWTHLAATYDGATVRLYVDGAEAAATPYAGALATSSGALSIGGNAVWGEWFAGLIDDVRVYDRALTAAEIQGDMARPVGDAAPPPAAGLVAAYGLDEGSGAVAADASGAGHRGSIASGAWTAGKFGRAVAFNGTSTWITVADDAALDLTGAMTLEAWVNPTSNAGWRAVINKEQAGDIVYALCSSSSTGAPAVAISRGAGRPEDIARGAAAIPLGAWTHLAATYDGTALRVYVNGAAAGSLAVSGPIATSSGALRIGGNAIWGEYFTGAIDEVRVYARALSAAEIQRDMTTPIGAPPGGDAQPPSQPTALAAGAVGQTSATLSWAASTDDVGVTGYELFRDGQPVATVAAGPYTFTGLSCATSYSLGVRARDAAGNVSGTAALSVTTAACPPGGGDGLANVWIDQNGGSCAVSATPIAYAGAGDAASCASFDAAWDAMSAGQTARVVAGTYGPQLVTGNKTAETRIIGDSKTTTILTGTVECFNPAQFGSASAMCAMADHLTVEDMRFDSGPTESNSSAAARPHGAHVTFRNVDLYGSWPNIYISGPYFTWQNGSHGADGVIPPPMRCDRSYGLPVWVDAPNATIDHVRFNVKRVQVGAGPYCGADNVPHLENIRIESSGDDLVVQNSWFVAGSDAGSGHIFTSASPTGVVLRNNVFEPVNGTYFMQGTLGSGAVFAYNTFEQPSGLSSSAFTWIGNLGVGSPGCSGTHVANVWQGDGACASDTFVGAQSLAIGSGGHIAATSPAIDRAEVAGAGDYCTHALGAADRDGDARPRGSACDAGADER